jgi:hypothetical protein
MWRGKPATTPFGDMRRKPTPTLGRAERSFIFYNIPGLFLHFSFLRSGPAERDTVSDPHVETCGYPRLAPAGATRRPVLTTLGANSPLHRAEHSAPLFSITFPVCSFIFHSSHCRPPGSLPSGLEDDQRYGGVNSPLLRARRLRPDSSLLLWAQIVKEFLGNGRFAVVAAILTTRTAALCPVQAPHLMWPNPLCGAQVSDFWIGKSETTPVFHSLRFAVRQD